MKFNATDFLPQDELLALLAEEASELAQAALKLRRIYDGRNPTPVGYQLAVKRLNEEVADVMLCLEQIHSLDNQIIDQVREDKLERWLTRLIEARRNADAAQNHRE